MLLAEKLTVGHKELLKDPYEAADMVSDEVSSWMRVGIDFVAGHRPLHILREVRSDVRSTGEGEFGFLIEDLFLGQAFVAMRRTSVKDDLRRTHTLMMHRTLADRAIPFRGRTEVLESRIKRVSGFYGMGDDPMGAIPSLTPTAEFPTRGGYLQYCQSSKNTALLFATDDLSSIDMMIWPSQAQQKKFRRLGMLD